MARSRFRPAAVFCTVLLLGAGASLATGLSALAQEAPGETTGTAGESTTTDQAETTSPTPTVPDPPPAPEPPAESPVPPRPAPPPPVAPPAPSSPNGGKSSGQRPAGPPARAPSPEIESGWAHPTVWLHRPVADPTPPASRLAPRFARWLRTASDRAEVRWSLVLAVLRARGEHGRVPVGRAALERIARHVAHRRASAFSDQVYALERYNRAVGLHGLVVGLRAEKTRLERRLLADRRIDLYPGGWVDVASGRVDVRVLVLIRYLAIRFGQVTVSSLHSGHGYWARPGVVSAHMYGFAVDISALGSIPISGHQGIGSITEHGVTAILQLPAELQPQQIISLMGLGGPSFPLPDHHDHIHVGY